MGDYWEPPWGLITTNISLGKVPVMSRGFYEELLPILCHKNCSKKKKKRKPEPNPLPALDSTLQFCCIEFVGIDEICYIRLKSHFYNGTIIKYPKL